MSRKVISKRTYLINNLFRLRHVFKILKLAEFLMITKPGKTTNEVPSHRPISLLTSFQAQTVFRKQFSYISDNTFRTKQNETQSELKTIVPPNTSVLGTTLYPLSLMKYPFWLYVGSRSITLHFNFTNWQ